MADVQNDLMIHGHGNANVEQGWDAWPEDQQDDNGIQQPYINDQQQEAISFDQLGSSAQYLRAHGPDITLTVEDMLAGNLGNTSSSSSSDASSQLVVQFQPSGVFLGC